MQIKRAGSRMAFAFLLAASTIGATSIPDNTWVDADLSYKLPIGLPNASWSTTDGYSGSVYNDSTGTVLWRTGVADNLGGCHLNPGFYSNAWLEWNPAEDTARVIDVFNWGGGSSGSGLGYDYCPLPAYLAGDTTPVPRHTYDGTAYCKNTNAIYLQLGATVRGTPTDSLALHLYSLDTASTWKFTLADRKWHRIPGNIRQFWSSTNTVSPYESHLEYWPEGRCLLFVDSKGTHLAKFDIESETWSQVTAANSPPFGGNSLYEYRSAWDSKRQLWVFRNDTNVCVYNPSSRTYTRLPNCGVISLDTASTTPGLPGIAYISKHDVYLVSGRTGNDTKVYHIPPDGTPIENGSWESVGGGEVTLPDYAATLQYDPKSDLTVLVNQKMAYKFRYVPSDNAADVKRPIGSLCALNVTPNPFQSSATLRFSSSFASAQVSLMDIRGKKVFHVASFNGYSLQMNTGSLAAGVYLVLVKDGVRTFQYRITLIR